jgi:hypothetical protein
MGLTDGVKGTFDWSVTGQTKLDTLDQRLTSLENHLGSAIPKAAKQTDTALAKTGETHALSGEKIAKYGTAIGLLTGQMQRFGVQNDLVTRGVQIGTEALTGTLGTLGLVTLAVGALATGIGALVLKHRENEQAIKDSNKALLDAVDANLKLATLSNPTGAIARIYLNRTEDQIRDSIYDLTARQRTIAEQQAAGGVTNQVGIVGPGFVPKYQFVAYTAKQMTALDKEASETAIALVLAQEQQLKLQASHAPYVGEPTGPFWDEIPEKYREASQRFNIGNLPPGQPDKPRPRYGSVTGRKFGLGGLPYTKPSVGDQPIYGQTNLLPGSSEIVSQMIREGQDAYAVLAEAAKGSADVQTAALQYVFSTHAKGYSAMSAMTQATQKASSMFVQRALEGENVSRLKGLTVARYVASAGAAAVIRGLGEEAEKHAAMEIAKALGSYPDPIGMAKHGAAALAFGALAGGAAGFAAGLESSAQKQFDSETTRNGLSSGIAAGNGTSVGLYSGSNPGGRVAASGASVGTINYNFIITYQGSVVFGDGGTRDWFYSQLVPLLNEGFSVGAIRAN